MNQNKLTEPEIRVGDIYVEDRRKTIVTGRDKCFVYTVVHGPFGSYEGTRRTVADFNRSMRNANLIIGAA